MIIINRFSIDPYRLFFTIGYLCLLVGAGLWMWAMVDPDFYPLTIHKYLVINGFMYSFISGFLFTAVPRFSQTDFMEVYEGIAYLSVFLLGFVFLLNNQERFLPLISSLQAFVLLMFIFKRITKRRQNPPYTFVFIFLGLILILLFGLLTYFEKDDVLLINEFLPITLIVIGVGGRLIPGILGHSEIVLIQKNKYEQQLPFIKIISKKVYGLIVLFLISLFLEKSISYRIYFFISLFWGMYFCKLYKKPVNRSYLAWGVWASTWMLILSFASQLIITDIGIHLTHGLFIGSFYILVLMVATRVMQSHGSKDISIEDSKVLLTITILGILSSLTRIAAYYMPDSYSHHLAYASLLLVISSIIWGIKYCSQLFISKD